MKNDADMYKQMYCKLFNAITDVNEICTDKKCVDLLKSAQTETEDIFIHYYE